MYVEVGVLAGEGLYPAPGYRGGFGVVDRESHVLVDANVLENQLGFSVDFPCFVLTLQSRSLQPRWPSEC